MAKHKVWGIVVSGVNPVTMPFIRSCAVLLLTLAVTIGCVQTTVDSYRKVPDSQVDSAYIKPGVDFSRYRKLQPVPLEIYYYEGQAEPDPADQEKDTGTIGVASERDWQQAEIAAEHWAALFRNFLDENLGH